MRRNIGASRTGTDAQDQQLSGSPLAARRSTSPSYYRQGSQFHRKHAIALSAVFFFVVYLARTWRGALRLQSQRQPEVVSNKHESGVSDSGSVENKAADSLDASKEVPASAIWRGRHQALVAQTEDEAAVISVCGEGQVFYVDHTATKFEGTNEFLDSSEQADGSASSRDACCKACTETENCNGFILKEKMCSLYRVLQSSGNADGPTPLDSAPRPLEEDAAPPPKATPSPVSEAERKRIERKTAAELGFAPDDEEEDEEDVGIAPIDLDSLDAPPPLHEDNQPPEVDDPIPHVEEDNEDDISKSSKLSSSESGKPIKGEIEEDDADLVTLTDLEGDEDSEEDASPKEQSDNSGVDEEDTSKLNSEKKKMKEKELSLDHLVHDDDVVDEDEKHESKLGGQERSPLEHKDMEEDTDSQDGEDDQKAEDHSTLDDEDESLKQQHHEPLLVDDDDDEEDGSEDDIVRNAAPIVEEDDEDEAIEDDWKSPPSHQKVKQDDTKNAPLISKPQRSALDALLADEGDDDDAADDIDSIRLDTDDEDEPPASKPVTRKTPVIEDFNDHNDEDEEENHNEEEDDEEEKVPLVVVPPPTTNKPTKPKVAPKSQLDLELEGRSSEDEHHSSLDDLLSDSADDDEGDSLLKDIELDEATFTHAATKDDMVTSKPKTVSSATPARGGGGGGGGGDSTPGGARNGVNSARESSSASSSSASERKKEELEGELEDVGELFKHGSGSAEVLMSPEAASKVANTPMRTMLAAGVYSVTVTDPFYQQKSKFFGRFRAVSEIHDFMTEWQAEFGKPAAGRSWQVDMFTVGKSGEGKMIKAIEFGNPNRGKHVFVIGGLRGCDWVAPLAIVHSIVALVGRKRSTAHLLDAIRFHVVPLVNVDGYHYSRRKSPAGARHWCDNRRISGGGHGVNLERNFGEDGQSWGFGKRGKEGRKDKHGFQGLTGFSEPETRAIKDYIDHYITGHGRVAVVQVRCCGGTITPPQLFGDRAKDASAVSAVAQGATLIASNIRASGEGQDYPLIRRPEAFSADNTGQLIDWTASRGADHSYALEIKALSVATYNDRYQINPEPFMSLCKELEVGVASVAQLLLQQPVQGPAPSPLLFRPKISAASSASSTATEKKSSSSSSSSKSTTSKKKSL